MKFCIIGAGNGGRAFAAYLSSKGHEVNMFNRSYSRLAEIIKKGSIRSTGVLKGTFPVKLATQDIEAALKDVDVILVVTPAFAHKDIAEKIAPYLTQEQIILLNPGRTFGAAEFKKIIQDKYGKIPIFIGETQTLIFTSRQLDKNKVQMLATFILRCLAPARAIYILSTIAFAYSEQLSFVAPSIWRCRS